MRVHALDQERSCHSSAVQWREERLQRQTMLTASPMASSAQWHSHESLLLPVNACGGGLAVAVACAAEATNRKGTATAMAAPCNKRTSLTHEFSRCTDEIWRGWIAFAHRHAARHVLPPPQQQQLPFTRSLTPHLHSLTPLHSTSPLLALLHINSNSIMQAQAIAASSAAWQ